MRHGRTADALQHANADGLYEAILKRGQVPARDLAATGSGQAAKGLSPYFAKVVALKPRLGATEAGSTFAKCLHWFDHDRFNPEVHGILKPGGCIAAWGYDIMTFPEKQRAQEELHQLFTFTLGPYWHPRVDHVWQHYKGRLGLSTWSAYNSYREDRPSEPAPGKISAGSPIVVA
ncbi:hypothetical protein WJX77_000859 [Trebouxia sp. C0004]